MRFRQKNIFLAILNQGEIDVELTKVLTTIIQQEGFRVGLFFPQGKPITNNRNTIVSKFLAQPEYDYLMMIDSDIIPPHNILNLATLDKDIITPLMFIRQKGMLYPLILKRHKDGVHDVPKDYLEMTGLQEVDATGTGCIIIKRKVLEAMKHPFRNEYDSDGIKRMGNDLSFCKRAKALGFKVYVHLDYKCSHISRFDLKELYDLLLERKRLEDKYEILKKALEELDDETIKKITKKVEQEELLKFATKSEV